MKRENFVVLDYLTEERFFAQVILHLWEPSLLTKI